MPCQSKVELYAAIRRDARAGLSGRALQAKHGVGWRTVQAAMSSVWPAERRQHPKGGSKLDPFKAFIDAVLREDLGSTEEAETYGQAPGCRLSDEHGMDGVSHQTARDYVAERKSQARAEAGRGSAEVFIRQTHRPGEEAEVDFGDVTIRR
ncbi:hypothetical protein [Nocardia cyriacigeorgica]|uniref:Transposase and inactivated derivatives n=1 Tax=Nocardia cyriacigeorgica TaxID=135487 RepID=A0A4U8VSV3_9NOCA|nr:hypothetical protein [Nocardia cyriacigeorgica]VFA96302.1 Transposase and inactivated derivatives [Nocardia cyriacigeorgica]